METKPRLLTVSRYNDRPRIILQGIRLEKYGFKPGDKIVVSCIEPGQLMIKTESQNTTPTINDQDDQQQPSKTSKAAESKAPYYRSFYPRSTH
jgi:hypothetical protein